MSNQIENCAVRPNLKFGAIYQKHEIKTVNTSILFLRYGHRQDNEVACPFWKVVLVSSLSK